MLRLQSTQTQLSAPENIFYFLQRGSHGPRLQLLPPASFFFVQLSFCFWTQLFTFGAAVLNLIQDDQCNVYFPLKQWNAWLCTCVLREMFSLYFFSFVLETV